MKAKFEVEWEVPEGTTLYGGNPSAGYGALSFYKPGSTRGAWLRWGPAGWYAAGGIPANATPVRTGEVLERLAAEAEFEAASNLASDGSFLSRAAACLEYVAAGRAYATNPLPDGAARVGRAERRLLEQFAGRRAG